MNPALNALPRGLVKSLFELRIDSVDKVGVLTVSKITLRQEKTRDLPLNGIAQFVPGAQSFERWGMLVRHCGQNVAVAH